MSEDSKKILIIEDDKFLSKMLVKMLEAKSYEITTAATGSEALTKIMADKTVDLILLDIMMPDIDGFDLLQQIRSDPALVKKPVIILSNLGQPEDINRGRALGIKDYIVKSDLSLEEIGVKVKKYLSVK